MARVTLRCHDCDETFDREVDNEYGLYEFTRCPNCGSAQTTLADG